jgi:hypothetical protein
MNTSVTTLVTRPEKPKKSNFNLKLQIQLLLIWIVFRLKKKKGSIFQSVSSLQKTSAKVILK